MSHRLEMHLLATLKNFIRDALNSENFIPGTFVTMSCIWKSNGKFKSVLVIGFRLLLNYFPMDDELSTQYEGILLGAF